MSFVAPEMESGKHVSIIYFDFRKAFEMLPYEILLRKINCCDLMGSKSAWAQSYLTKRPFNVKVAGEISNSVKLPQVFQRAQVLG